MSLESSQSAGDGPPADDEGRSFTTGIGSMVAPTPDEDEETALPPLRPTFTARSSEPVSPVPEQAPAPDYSGAQDDPADDAEPDDAADLDDAAEPESTVPTMPAPEADDGMPVEADGTPDAGPAWPASPALADLASTNGDGTAARPLTTAAGLDEPLLSDADGFRARWHRAQAGFIDDPREAVGDAADLIEQTAQALVGALRQRQRELRVLWERGPAGDTAPADGADTEHLRLMMQRYRALFNQLCRP
jgi:hypothetical protein